tara:strand:- start:260 stop:514 length:255 start_codon:yes stop_codon:yes gene_type:complete
LAKLTIGDDALKNLTKLFEKIGWEKRLCDLTQDEIVVTILIMQFSKGMENDKQFTKEYYDRLLLEYAHEQKYEREQEEQFDSPF